ATVFADSASTGARPMPCLAPMVGIRRVGIGQGRRSWAYQRTPQVWKSMLTTSVGVVNGMGRLKVSGTIPNELRGRSLLMAANHIGVFDAIVLMAACRRIGIAPRFMLAGGLLDAPRSEEHTSELQSRENL